MDVIGEWVASGRVLDVILAGMALEAALLVWLWRSLRRGLPTGELWPNLAAGACLLGAMRAGLAGAWWVWVAALLLGALVFHGLDFGRRWRGAP